MAVDEAKSCLNCPKKPCISACPVAIDIPAFIERVANEDLEGAFQVLSQASALPAVCGRVCPQENQCEGKCVRGIKGESVGIGRLERFVADYHREQDTETPISLRAEWSQGSYNWCRSFWTYSCRRLAKWAIRLLF